MPLSQFLKEEINEVAQHIPQERMQNGTEEQIVDVPVPQCRNETGEVIQIFPQDRISDCIVDQIVGRLHEVTQKDLSTLEQACRNDFSKLDAACNACDARNLVRDIGALEADMEKTHSDSLTHETRLAAVESSVPE